MCVSWGSETRMSKLWTYGGQVWGSRVKRVRERESIVEREVGMLSKNGVGWARGLVPGGRMGLREPLSRNLVFGVSLWPR